ncbi:hypothetical protein [Prosthecobacter sp.]|uniref:hypothetical protein n=1 Tax=Prosthecobacter sp. TaxID=1965333 RepID=UPI003784D857
MQLLQHGADAATRRLIAKLQSHVPAFITILRQCLSDIISSVACLPKLFPKTAITHALPSIWKSDQGEAHWWRALRWHVELEVGFLFSVKTVVRAINDPRLQV